jgi:hypothetical protein
LRRFAPRSDGLHRCRERVGLHLDLRIEARLTPPQSFGRPEVASRASIRISLNAQPGEWNGDSADSSRFPSQRLSHPGGTRTTVALPVVVMRPLTVRPDQRIGVASSLNFALKAMGLRARGQNHALMDPPARFAHYQTAKRLPDLRLPVAERSPGPVPEKNADASSFRHTLLVPTYGTPHDVDPSFRYLRHAASPGRGRLPT